jgi:transcriptional regulator with XRE-family HTH domain
VLLRLTSITDVRTVLFVTTPETAEILAANVRAEMARQRIKQSTVAAHLGLAQPSVSKRLTGQVPFDVNQLTQLSALLGVSVARLLEQAGPASPPVPSPG